MTWVICDMSNIILTFLKLLNIDIFFKKKKKKKKRCVSISDAVVALNFYKADESLLFER